MGEPSTRNEYLIIADVLDTLANRYGMKSEASNSEFVSKVRELENEFYKKLQDMVDEGIVVRRIDPHGLSEKILAEVSKMEGKPTMVCLDRSYFPDALHINVTTDYAKRVVAHYDSPSLEVQADEIRDRLKTSGLLRGGKEPSVVLVDVGISEGVTLFKIIPFLVERGIQIDGIVSGVTSINGERNIKEKFSYEIITVEPKTWATWKDERDLFLIDGTQVPKEAQRGTTRRFLQYTECVDSDPYSKIRTGKLYDFRELCKDMNTRLLTELRELRANTTAIGEPMNLQSLQRIARAIRSSNRM